jgi:uncharacterized membrane protein
MLLLANALTHLDRYGDFGHSDDGHRPLRILVLVLFLLLIGTVIWLVVREVNHRREHPVAAAGAAVAGAGGQPADAALEALRIRYARSEISRDEYLQMAEDLAGPRAT